ncbi:MAG: hypothetical protein H0W83_07040 [Planctomycetes bacterium]|nr:hypothetical protein [Planctomycetota bacterium]
MKAMIVALVACAATYAPALETPLVLRSPGSNSGDQVIEVSPNLGTIALFQVTESGTRQAGSANFLFDLEFYDKYIVDERNGVPYSTLRIGSPNSKPTCEGMLALMPKDPTEAEKAKNVLSYQARARAAEDAYWLKDHDYDGVVRGAFNGTYAMLCIPSKHALLFYELSGEKLTLSAYRNFGVDLLVPQGWNTSPLPSEIAKRLPDDEKKKLEKELADKEKEGSKEVAETPKSDTWVAAASNNIFVVVDTLNNQVMSYQFTGKSLEVKSVRNLKYDLMIPGSFKPLDNEADVFTRFRKVHEKQIQELGIEVDLSGMKALVGANTKGDASKTGMQATVLDKLMILDFTESRKLLVFNLEGAGNGLELASARDYTLDVAMALMDKAFNEKSEAKKFIASAEKYFKSHKTAMLQLKFALKMDPTLVDSVEKNTRLKGELSKEADWPTMLDDAHKAAELILDQRKKMKEKAAEARNPKK